MLVLRLLRKINSVRRRLVGADLPHWYKDLLGLIRYFNLLRLVPTLSVIAMHPSHFFKSLPAILAGKKRHYLSPLQFVSNAAIVQLLLLPHVYAKVRTPPKEVVVGINLATALVSPLLIAMASGLLLVLWYVCMHIWPMGTLAREFGWRFNYHSCMLPLDFMTYKVLDYRRYCWSMLYFYLYFYVMAAAVLSTGLFSVLGIFDFYVSAGSGTVYFNKITLIPFLLAGVGTAYLGYLLFLRPYTMLLIASSGAITGRMRRYMVHENTA